MRNRRVPAILASTLVTCALASLGVGAQNARDPVRAALAQRIDEARNGTGALVGLLTPEGRSFAVHGRVRIDGPMVTPDTIVEIGSIGKVFVGFLLADLVTHTSGLPRDSVPVDMESDRSQYAGYTADQLFAFLGRYRLERAPGAQWEYSNVGMGLLGHALALRAGTDYDALVRRRLFDPLGMTDTRLAFNAEQSARRATGHNLKLMPVPPWTGGVIAPTGGYSSTAVDVMKFAADVLNAESPRRAVYARMTSVKRPGSGRRVQQTMGWELYWRGANETLAHNGGTFGFEARLLVDMTGRRAVVAWANGRSSGSSVINLVGAAIDQPTLR